MEGVRVTQSIQVNQKVREAGKVQPELQLIHMFEKGLGCNLTLFNYEVVKEGENEDENLGKINQHLASGLNNSLSSLQEAAAVG